MQIKEEKPEFFEYAKPIWEQINENMIQRGELREPWKLLLFINFTAE